MKTLIIALNSKYIHSALAAWYLKAVCDNNPGGVKVLEFTINDNMEAVLGEIYSEKPDVAAFSCYIWNISYVLKLARNLKKVCPEIVIVLGGPEVSYDQTALMEKEPEIDYLIAGEGEESFPALLSCLRTGKPALKDIAGLTCRNGSSIVSNGLFPVVENLDLIPSPYSDEMLASLKDKIVYFEASRGCPYQCTYCLSSTTTGVRYFSLDRVKKELDRLIEAGVKQVKFVDRTFNCNRARAKEIFKYIIGRNTNINFHFEAAADLFDEEMLDILSEAENGKIQLEIGIQSTNPETLAAIHRSFDPSFSIRNIERLIGGGNIHIHLDLIAGLPYEDYNTFRKSFDDVYRLNPHALQLGFLKLLKGTRILAESQTHGYRYRDYPPYEVLSSSYISYEELLVLKEISELVDRFYNSGKFVASIGYIVKTFFSSAFDFYREFHIYNKKQGNFRNSAPLRQLYSILLAYGESIMGDEKLELFNELLKLDYLSSDNSKNLPEDLEREVQAGFKEKCFDFLKNEDNIEKYLPEFKGVPAKQIFRQVHFERFNYDVLAPGDDGSYTRSQTTVLFDYSTRDRVTGLYSRIRLGKI